MRDAELTRALMQAHQRTMFFAFILKGGDGKLIVSRSKIQLKKETEEARKRFGGGTPVYGRFSGPITGLVFQVAKVPLGTLGARLGPTLKKVVKRDTGLNIVVAVLEAAELGPDDLENFDDE
jgi:hypothetical protein